MKKSCFRRKGAGRPLCSHKREDKRIRYPLLVLAGLISIPTLSGRLLDTLAVLWDVKGFHPIRDLSFFSLSHVCDIKDITPFSKTLKQSSVLVCYTVVFSIVTQHSSPQTLCDDTKNGCVADYISLQAKKHHLVFP